MEISDLKNTAMLLTFIIKGDFQMRYSASVWLKWLQNCGRSKLKVKEISFGTNFDQFLSSKNVLPG